MADDAERARAVDVVGLPSELTAAAKIAALPIMAEWRDSLIAHVEAGGEAGLTAWQASVEEDPALVSAIFRTRLQADMAGQLFVRAIEVPESLPTRVLAADTRPSFLRLTFQEALDVYLERRLVTREEYEELSAVARRDAFSAVQLASEDLVKRAGALLNRHFEDGGSLRSFVQGMRAGEITIGIEPASPAYLETVFRTNVQSGYGAGRLRQLEHPAVEAARPWVEYRTAHDSRVRDAHAALDGVIFNRADDPGWRQIAPPLGFNCRCVIRTLREADVDRRRVKLSSDLGIGQVYPDGSSIDSALFAGPGV